MRPSASSAVNDFIHNCGIRQLGGRIAPHHLCPYLRQFFHEFLQSLFVFQSTRPRGARRWGGGAEPYFVRFNPHACSPSGPKA